MEAYEGLQANLGALALSRYMPGASAFLLGAANTAGDRNYYADTVDENGNSNGLQKSSPYTEVADTAQYLSGLLGFAAPAKSGGAFRRLMPYLSGKFIGDAFYNTMDTRDTDERVLSNPNLDTAGLERDIADLDKYGILYGDNGEPLTSADIPYLQDEVGRRQRAVQAAEDNKFDDKIRAAGDVLGSAVGWIPAKTYPYIGIAAAPIAAQQHNNYQANEAMLEQNHAKLEYKNKCIEALENGQPIPPPPAGVTLTEQDLAWLPKPDGFDDLHARWMSRWGGGQSGSSGQQE
jgi:hypothetical protein